MPGWAEALRELERADFEVGRAVDAEAAQPWMRLRETVLCELNRLPVAEAGATEMVRLVQAAERGRELQGKWRRTREILCTEAENAYAAQLLVRALAPERRGRLVNLQV